MSKQTTIEWTDSTVNFWWGCTKVGPGCDHCYAETWSSRFGESIWGVGAPRRKIKSAVSLIHRLDNDYAAWAADRECGLLPAHSGIRRRVFVQSMSDLFDLEVELEWFDEAWQHIEACSRIGVQIVTKRVSVVEKRLAAIGRATWPPHAGLIITACNQAEADRDISRLKYLKTKLGIPWVGLSIEPMLGPMVLDLAGIDWVIVGGESGQGARPMHPDWARSIRDQCAAAGVAFFFKQWGSFRVGEYDENRSPWISWQDGTEEFYGEHQDIKYAAHWMGKDDGGLFIAYPASKRAAGRLLDGIEHNGMPEARS